MITGVVIGLCLLIGVVFVAYLEDIRSRLRILHDQAKRAAVMPENPIKLRDDLFDNLDDCRRIVAALNAKGLQATIEQAQLVWSRHSSDLEAGWLGLPDGDDEIVEIIESYLFLKS